MGCDIHSFVMVPDNKTGLYRPLIVRACRQFTYSDVCDWGEMQPYDNRFYDFFGFLTNGRVRSSVYDVEGVSFEQGMFPKNRVDPKSIDYKLIDDEDAKRNINSTAACYYRDDSYFYHSHGWTTLSQLKRNKSLLTKYIKKLEKKITHDGYPDDCEQKAIDIDEIQSLKCIRDELKLMINNVKAMLCATWSEDTIDDHVIVCFAFDS